MTKPKIGIILSTTRETRFADRPAAWVKTIASAVTTIGACVWWSRASIGFWNARRAPW